MTTQDTIKGLFGRGADHFEIPKYQRAYSWEREQWGQFLEDLKDAESRYYLGHFLFESDGDGKYFVIDGQQRLTTCVIFVSAALDVLNKYGEDYKKNVRIWRHRFLEEPDLGPRMKTVPLDNPVFQDCIVSGKPAPMTFQTQSAENLVEAKKYFAKKLDQFGAEDVCLLIQRLENAVITTFEVTDRAMASQVFAFQNDRGKDLTKLEKLKSFLMMTVYMKGTSDATKETTVESIDTQFGRIYETITRIRVKDEDQILAHFLRAKYGYNASPDGKDNVKEQLATAENPVEWVKDFVRQLADSFSFVEEFESDSGEYPVRLRLLGNMALSYPFLIRARLCGIRKDSSVFEKLLKLMENITFRSQIRGGRADIQSRLNDHLKRIDDEISLLHELEQIVEAIKNEWWGGCWNYWNDGELARRLCDWFYGNRVDNYLLWQYERSLYVKGYKAPVVVTAQEMMKNESIEHIAPQTQPNESLASGYGAYDDKEIPDNGISSGGWMNRLGNLMLASQSQNSSIGNKPFGEKLADYSQRILMQQTEIKDYAGKDENGEPCWTVDSIRKRQRKIVEWAMKNWDISYVLS